MKRIGFLLSLLALSSCAVVPNLGMRDVLRGKVSASGDDVRVAVYSANLDSSAVVVKPDSDGNFSYEIPFDAQVFSVCAFRDTNGNGRFDDSEPSSKDSSFLVLTKVSENWEMVEHSGGQLTKKDDISSADLTLRG
ncbi:MAG TPA: hypothetical protein DD435_16145 [Cyanobacteria bacterium UBA8530]|nr:hypothetical protein [Cyanobacteria bacterium UBA8530]